MALEDENTLSPLAAAISGRDEGSRDAILDRFAGLPERIRELLVSKDTTRLILQWEQSGLFPSQYRLAILKSLALTSLGEIRPDQLESLFGRIGLSDKQAETLAARIRAFTEPILSREEPETPEVTLDPEAGEPEELREIPPLTGTPASGQSPQPVATPPTSSARAVPNEDARNIIDLRKSP